MLGLFQAWGIDEMKEKYSIFLVAIKKTSNRVLLKIRKSTVYKLTKFLVLVLITDR